MIHIMVSGITRRNPLVYWPLCAPGLTPAFGRMWKDKKSTDRQGRAGPRTWTARCTETHRNEILQRGWLGCTGEKRKAASRGVTRHPTAMSRPGYKRIRRDTAVPEQGSGPCHVTHDGSRQTETKRRDTRHRGCLNCVVSTLIIAFELQIELW